jgi:hypothetical protein
MARRILRLSLLVFPLLTSALHNITVDDNAPAIVYSGSWTSASGTTVGDYGGTRHWTNSTADPTATATFTFIGTTLHPSAQMVPRLIRWLQVSRSIIGHPNGHTQ